MATAKVVTATPRIILDLSLSEAETLRILFSRTGGASRGSRREHVSAMDDALIHAGVQRPKASLVAHMSPNLIIFNKETLND